MTVFSVTVGALSFLVVAAGAEALLPRCSSALDGQVAAGGCKCRHDSGGLLTNQRAGWRWSCDLLLGPGGQAPPEPASQPMPGLPPGFTYAPQQGTGPINPMAY